jgi:EpsI family protein
MKSSLSAFRPACVLLAGCALLLKTHFHPAMPLRSPLELILPSAGELRVENLELPDDERVVAGMTDYIARLFWRDSTWAATVFVAYYDRQTQGRTIHSPRNCLPGAGWEIMAGGLQDVQSNGTRHRINRYVLKNGPNMAVVYYWYQGRGRVVANEYTVKWNLLRDAALTGHTEEALVRVVVPVTSSAAVAGPTSPAWIEAETLAKSMASRLISEVSQALPASDRGERLSRAPLSSPGPEQAALRVSNAAASVSPR